MTMFEIVDSIMSKFSTNDKWHIEILSTKKYVIKHILKHQIGIFYAVYEIKCVKNLQLNVFKCMLALLLSIEIEIESQTSAIWDDFAAFIMYNSLAVNTHALRWYIEQ